jgi:prepilin-type N-terminal cleavage/methylation domain-containing protein
MRPDRRPRSGWTLLELMVVITAVSILMGFTAALAAQLLRYGKVERAAVVAAANLERLGRDIRNDARVATGPAELSETSLVLTQAEGRSIEYLVRPADILRTIRRSGKTMGFDTYKLPTGTLARFESGRDGGFPSVALVLRLNPATNPSSATESAYRDYRIEAFPGRDARLARGVIR